MNRIVSILCAVCLMIGAPSNVLATDLIEDGMASTTITYTVPSQFCVYIPETIDMTTDSYTFTASIMDIADNERVDVRITNLDGSSFNMSNPNGATASASFIRNDTNEVLSNNDQVAQFSNGSLESYYSISLTNVNAYNAGTYSGIAEFSVSLVQW